MPPVEPPPQDELITLRAMMAQMHIAAKSTAYRRIRAKTLPSPVDFGNGQIRFRASEVAEFIRALPPKVYTDTFKRPTKKSQGRSH